MEYEQEQNEQAQDERGQVTYASLKAKAEAIMLQAEALRRGEIAQVVMEIKSRMREYGLTVADLEDRRSQLTARGRVPKAPKVARFRGPDGEPWGGGPGRKPKWVLDLIEQGGDIEQYRVAA